MYGMTGTSLPQSVLAWREHGRHLDIGGNAIFVVDTGAAGAADSGAAGAAGGDAVVILHGFPGSSHDWARVVPLIARRRRVVVFDLLGYGLSDKPPDASYSLFGFADLAEAVLAETGVRRCALVAHDLGDTVAAELLHRHNAGQLGLSVERAILTNGSIFIDMARLTRGQRLALALPGRALPFPLPTWLLRRSLRESFTRDAPPPDGAVEELVSLVRHHDGARLIPKQIRYIAERRAHQPRWTAALVDYDGPLTALWGDRDPIAVAAMPRRLAELRPETELVTWPDIGHWPSIEAPERMAEAIIERL